MDKKILILEDDPELAELYAECIEADGYDTEIANNGKEGLEKLKKMKPDLILLDLGMPKMNGIEFYQNLCGQEERPRYPILVLTGRANLTELFKDLYVDGFIMKPFGGNELLSKIETILNKQYWRKTDGTARKIVIVDDNLESAQKISCILAHVGYKSEIATSGLTGIEKVMNNPPDLAVISLGLNDLSGDLVILRLQQLMKRKETRYILYIRKNYKHDKAVMEHFAHKTGVKLMCEYAKPSEILEATVALFQEHGK